VIEGRGGPVARPCHPGCEVFEEMEINVSDDKREATFHPGQAPVYGHTPMDWLANYGRPVPPDPDPAVDREHYQSPGPPPWDSRVHQDLAVQHGWPTPGEKRRGLPAWAWVSIVLGGLFILCSGAVALGLVGESGPVPAVHTPAEPGARTGAVTTTGTCEKRVIGQYGLVATVTATNTGKADVTGTVWVRWPVTGEAAQEFTKRVTLKPGQAVEFPVNQDIPAERWFRTGACSFGWVQD
jgi:hypothetical protein